MAWYYEKEGLRPIMVGHSQGGFQAVKILHKFAGDGGDSMAVYNPLTWSRENRYTITDPRTGKTRPVVGLKLGVRDGDGKRWRDTIPAEPMGYGIQTPRHS